MNAFLGSLTDVSAETEELVVRSHEQSFGLQAKQSNSDFVLADISQM